jgi:type III secretion protein L
MLICRLGEWRIESDGHLSAHELSSLEGLRAVEAKRADETVRERVRLGARVRELKRRAWRRAHSAGKAAALREHVAGAAAVAFAAHRLEERLTQLVLGAVTDIVGRMPPSAALTNQLRRAVAVSQSQRLVSVRVAPPVFDEARQLILGIEHELGMPFCTVLADAGLPAYSCVVETEAGVIDGGLKVQLRALERGIRDGVAGVLRSYDLADTAGLTRLDAIEQGLRETLAALAAAPLEPPPEPPPAPSPQPTSEPWPEPPLVQLRMQSPPPQPLTPNPAHVMQRPYLLEVA